jgi:hypothetical protein
MTDGAAPPVDRESSKERKHDIENLSLKPTREVAGDRSR